MPHLRPGYSRQVIFYVLSGGAIVMANQSVPAAPGPQPNMRARLLAAGFQRQLCSDGWFWVLERGPGPAAEQIFHLCARCLNCRPVGSIQRDLILQCKANYTEPMLYCDNKIWRLSNHQFQTILTALAVQQ